MASNWRLRFSKRPIIKKAPPVPKFAISERLQMLSLPNGHLVQAVLKQHQHLSSDHRERLQKLLRVIVTRNGNSKINIEDLNEQLRIESEKNIDKQFSTLQKEYKDTSSEVKKPKAPVVPTPKRFVTQVRHVTAKVIPLGWGQPPPPSRRPAITIVSRMRTGSLHSQVTQTMVPAVSQTEGASQASKATQENGRPGRCHMGRQKVAKRRYHGKLLSDYMREAKRATPLACGDCDTKLHLRLENVKPREDGDFKTRPKLVQQIKKEAPKPKVPKEEEIAPVCAPPKNEEWSSTYFCKNQAYFDIVKKLHDAGVDDVYGEEKMRLEEDMKRQETKPDSQKKWNIPGLVIRTYIAMMIEFESHSRMYRKCRMPMTKKSVIEAACACWSDYMQSVGSIFAVMQPYVREMVSLCGLYQQGSPELKLYESKIPKVLMDSVQELRSWSRTLRHSLHDIKKMHREQKESSRRLYKRYYDKFHAIDEHMDTKDFFKRRTFSG